MDRDDLTISEIFVVFSGVVTIREYLKLLIVKGII